MKFFTKEVKIALAAGMGIVVLFAGMNFLKGMTLFSSDSTYYVRFADISGLSASNPIYASGYKVGVVKQIDYDYAHNGGAVVRIDVDRNLRIGQGSEASIESDMMGNVKMNLRLAAGSALCAPGDTLAGAVDAGMMGKVAEMVPAVEKMLPKLDSIMASLNTLLADPAIAATLHNASEASAGLVTSTRELSQLLASLNHSVPALAEKADGVLANTQTLTGNLAALDVAGTMQRVNTVLDNVTEATARINSREGSLGLLMSDPALYHNLNRTMTSADSLLVNLREHPKRYVHFSLFGRKDK